MSANKYAALAQTNFSVFGLLKLIYGLTYIIDKDYNCLIPYSIQGVSLIVLSLINGDINSLIHQTSTYIGIFATMYILYFRWHRAKFGKIVKNTILVLLNSSMCVIFAIGLSYMAYASDFTKMYEEAVCEFFYWCFNAPVFSFGYHEWIILLWLLAMDWITCSDLISLLVRKLIELHRKKSLKEESIDYTNIIPNENTKLL